MAESSFGPGGKSFLLFCLLIFLAISVQIIPEWQSKRAGVHETSSNAEVKTTPTEIAVLQNEQRKTLLQAIGDLLTVVALYSTYRRVKVVAERAHITDRFTKAIEQLRSPTIKMIAD